MCGVTDRLHIQAVLSSKLSGCTGLAEPIMHGNHLLWNRIILHQYLRKCTPNASQYLMLFERDHGTGIAHRLLHTLYIHRLH